MAEGIIILVFSVVIMAIPFAGILWWIVREKKASGEE